MPCGRLSLPQGEGEGEGEGEGLFRAIARGNLEPLTLVLSPCARGEARKLRGNLPRTCERFRTELLRLCADDKRDDANAKLSAHRFLCDSV
jgi:hypothetical protein